MCSVGPAGSWLVENGPKELELLFRAIVYHPSAPILIADNDGNYRDASAGAGKLLGLPREKIIGRQMDDFAPPGFKPQVSQLWRAFLEQRRAGRHAPVGGSGRNPAGGGVHGQRQCPARAPRPCPARQDAPRRRRTHRTDQIPSWVQDYALYLLDADGRLPPGIPERNAFTAIRPMRPSGRHVSLLYPDEEDLRVCKLQEELQRAAAEGHVGDGRLAGEKGRIAILGQCHHHGAQG